MAQEAELLPSKSEALCSNPSTGKKQIRSQFNSAPQALRKTRSQTQKQ
jgi:hypothetical protein